MVDQINPKELAMRVREFIEAACTVVEVVYHMEGEELKEPEFMEADELLSAWLQTPEGQFAPMFIGWCIAKGINPNTFTAYVLMDAVCIALTGNSLQVLDGGFQDATRKPH